MKSICRDCLRTDEHIVDRCPGCGSLWQRSQVNIAVKATLVWQTPQDSPCRIFGIVVRLAPALGTNRPSWQFVQASQFECTWCENFTYGISAVFFISTSRSSTGIGA